MAKQVAWVIHATHPTTYQTNIIRRVGGTCAWAVHDVLIELGYLGVMISAADYYDGPKFEDPWAKMRAKGEIMVMEG